MYMYINFSTSLKLRNVQFLSIGDSWEHLLFIQELNADGFLWSSMGLLQDSSPTQVGKKILVLFHSREKY